MMRKRRTSPGFHNRLCFFVVRKELAEQQNRSTGNSEGNFTFLITDAGNEVEKRRLAGYIAVFVTRI
ncbi:MAG: hypothetical protein ACI4UV_09590 [Victivallales bacterium]